LNSRIVRIRRTQGEERGSALYFIGREAQDRVICGLWVHNFLCRLALLDFLRIGVPPDFKTAVETVDVGKALIDQVGCGALAGVAMVAGNDQRLIKVGCGNEVRQRVIVQVSRAANMPVGVAVRVADIYHNAALFAQGQGLLGGDALEVGHAGSLWSQSQRSISPLSRFIKVMTLPQTQPVSKANTLGSSQ